MKKLLYIITLFIPILILSIHAISMFSSLIFDLSAILNRNIYFSLLISELILSFICVKQLKPTEITEPKDLSVNREKSTVLRMIFNIIKVSAIIHCAAALILIISGLLFGVESKSLNYESSSGRHKIEIEYEPDELPSSGIRIYQKRYVVFKEEIYSTAQEQVYPDINVIYNNGVYIVSFSDGEAVHCKIN